MEIQNNHESMPDNRYKLTIDILKTTGNNGKVIASGVIANTPDGIYMTDKCFGYLLRWALMIGQNEDWSVYIHWYTTIDVILKLGEKVTTKSNLLKIIDFDDEVWERYRF